MVSQVEDKWYQLSGEAVLKAIGADTSGLTPDEVREKRLKFGANQLESRKKTSPVIVFLRQFLSPLIYILLVATIISIVVGHFIDAWVIMGVLLINAVIGFLEEGRAEQAMEALSRMVSPRAKVRRGGKVAEIPAAELVPGDILFLETGDKVPADARLLEVSNLRVNEAALTGESMPIEKHTRLVAGEAPVAERKNTVFMGTIINYGRATAVVVRTGMATEMGKIATGLMEVKPEPTPLQQNITRMSRYIIIMFLGVLALLVIVGLLRGLGAR
ncbi:MAG: HAD-IC family P-type ATPase, partial [Dehalococcoidales bacterium]